MTQMPSTDSQHPNHNCRTGADRASAGVDPCRPGCLQGPHQVRVRQGTAIEGCLCRPSLSTALSDAAMTSLGHRPEP